MSQTGSHNIIKRSTLLYLESIDQDLKILFHVISHVTLQNLLANNENFCSDSFLLCIADLIVTSEGIVNIKT